MNLQNLFGYWNLTGFRHLNKDGTTEDEKVFGGAAAFTQSGELLTFTRTSELPFGYTGKFTVENDALITVVQVCSIPELEGKTIRGKIKRCTPESLILVMYDEATDRDYEIEFVSQK